MINPQIQQRIKLSPKAICEFCQQNQIQELSIFGSVLRDDFRPDSDLDFLVTFDPQTHYSLMDLVRIQYQLEDLTGRKIDLLEKRSILASHNWIRRQNILETAQIIYESGQHLSAFGCMKGTMDIMGDIVAPAVPASEWGVME